MTTKSTFNLNGMAQYLEDIAQAGKDIDAAAQRALTKGGMILQVEMDALVPIDKGNLKADIVLDGPYQDGNLNYIEVGVVNADAKVAIYGNVQEYGSPSKNIPAQSYIRAAIDRKKAAVMSAIRTSLKAEGFVN